VAVVLALEPPLLDNEVVVLWPMAVPVTLPVTVLDNDSFGIVNDAAPEANVEHCRKRSSERGSTEDKWTMIPLEC